LSLLRNQTVEPEIIVVDSGSTDGTREIASRLCDRLIDIPTNTFSFGYALNVGARAASAPVHFAVSAHCFPERSDWIERSLEHYRRPDVAGTQGSRELPDGSPLREAFIQDAAFARAHLHWGFSNHASSWRASVWQRFPFDERLGAAEDREWALRVLDAGWVIAVDPELWVDLSHQWRSGVADSYRRHKIGREAIVQFASPPRYRASDLVSEWWGAMPDRRHSPWLHRLDYRRTAGLIGKWSGDRAARRSPGAPVDR